MSHRRLTYARRCLAVLMLGVGALAGVANADTGRVTDPNEPEARNRFDIKAASHGHSGSRLTHTITVYGVLAPRSRWQEGDYMVGIDGCTSSGPDYWLETDPSSPTRATLIRPGPDANITVKRLDDQRLRFIFSPELIGDPDLYCWTAQAFWADPYTGQGYIDRTDDEEPQKDHCLRDCL